MIATPTAGPPATSIPGPAKRLVDEDGDEINPNALEEAIQRIINRTPEEILESRRRIYATSIPPRPLPPGKTLNDVVEGTWPGDETDEEIFKMLEELS